jgi:hypothetical protein
MEEKYMNKLKKVMVFFITFCLLIVSLNLAETFVSAENSFSSGDGSVENPYVITTPAQLNLVRKGLSKHYVLGADIVFTEQDFAEGGAFYNSGNFWSPIGTSSTPFSGSFSGNGFAICGLKIYTVGKVGALSASGGDDGWSGDYIIGGGTVTTISPTMGLFGYNTGVIKDLSVEIKLLYGRASNSRNMYVGGVVGYNTGTVSGCYVFGNVHSGAATTPLTYSGLIVGYNNGGVIENCYGGGRVAGDYSGGIVGGSESGSITNCYSLSVGVNYKSFGGILGYNKDVATTLTNCYYDTAKGKGVGKGEDTTTALTLEQMENGEAFTGFDFENIWTMGGEKGYIYPELVKSPARFSQSLMGIEVATLPFKTEYLEGKEDFDPAGGELSLVYDNGVKVNIPLSEAQISGFDKNVLGAQNITVTYGEKTAPLIGIIVKTYVVTSIEIINIPNTQIYALGQKIKAEGGKLKITYSGNREEEVEITEQMLSQVDNSTLGLKEVTVTYGGKQTSFEVYYFAPGDANGDGELNMDDVVILSKYAAGYSVELSLGANTNGDDKINLSDAVHLARFLAEWDNIELSQNPYQIVIQ